MAGSDASAAPSRAPQASPAGAAAAYHEVLPNGLTLLLQETQLAPVANLQIWARVGSADEQPHERGLAHFHEHMLFKGTESRGVGDVAGDVEAAGGRINAYTTFDTTVYYATLPSESLGLGLDVLVDAVRYSRFDPEEIQREREVVLEEIRRAEDSPGHVLSDAVFRTAYQRHPYGLPILGTAESVAAFERDQVLDFFRRWYAPDNLVVVAAGDFAATALAHEIRARFGDAPAAAGAPRRRTAEPAQRALRTRVLRRSFEGLRMDLAWRTTGFSSPDAALLDLLSFVLGESESSRLMQRVKDGEELVDRIDSSSYTPLDPGLFSINLETDAARARDAVAAVVREVERLRVERVTEDELERARANFLANEHFERESVAGMASRLGSAHVLGGDYRGHARYLERIRRATPDDLRRVAREHLHPSGLNVAAVQSEGDTLALDEAGIREAVERGVTATDRRFAAPARSSAPESRVWSYELANGARVHVVRRPDVPVVAARAAFLGGLLAETPETAGVSSFLSSMWTRGTRARSASDFARAIESLAGEINGFSGRSSLGFSLDATRDKLEPVLDLFAEALLEPAFDAGEIERERRETLSVIERRSDRLAQLAYLQLSELLFPAHPYRLPMLGTAESVRGIDAALLRSHQARLIQPENMVVALAGDVDPDAAAEAVAVRTSDLPGEGFTRPAPPADDPPREIRERRLEKARAQAHLVIGFYGLTVDDPDRYVLDVLSQVLAGQGGRLFLELRDRKSLAYSVSAVNMEGVAPGFFSVYIATAPEKVAEARRGMLAELERLVEQAPPEEELARARRYLAGSHAIDAQRNGNHAAHVALDALYGLGPEAHYAYADRIHAVTREDVLRVARRVLTLDAYAISLVGDV